jgi:hypothetical protein
MRLTAIIPHFYWERTGNLRTIVDSLRSGTVVPEEIIVWNNERDPVTIAGAFVVQSPRNIGAKARLLAAVMARGERVLFLDNDIAVRRRTVENLLSWSCRHWERPTVVTLEGRERPFSGAPYSRWPKVYGRGLREPAPVFLSLGRGEMLRRRDLLAVLPGFPFEDSTVMDDLWLSECFFRHEMSVVVVPCVPGESDLEDLPMGGVGLCRQATFNAERTRVALTIACDEEALRAESESA